MSTAKPRSLSRSSDIAHEECWYGVTDPQKRKKLQDRLAQRARRKTTIIIFWYPCSGFLLSGASLLNFDMYHGNAHLFNVRGLLGVSTAN